MNDKDTAASVREHVRKFLGDSKPSEGANMLLRYAELLERIESAQRITLLPLDWYSKRAKANGWMEIDCPECSGIDYDVALDATTCSLGHVLSAETLADANRYDSDGNCV